METKQKVIVGAVGLAIAVVGYTMIKNGGAAAADTSGGGGLNSPVMFVPGGGGGMTAITGSGGTGLIDPATNTGATYSAPLTDLSTSPIPVFDLSSDAVQASQAVGVSQIMASLTSHLSDNASALLAQVVSQFGSTMPTDFSGAFSTIGGHTNFDWHASGLSTTTPIINGVDVVTAPPAPGGTQNSATELSQNDISLINSYASGAASNGVRSLDAVVAHLTSPGVMTLPDQYKNPAALKTFIQGEAYYTGYLNQFLAP